MIVVHLVDSVLAEPDWSVAFIGAIALGVITTTLSLADGALTRRLTSAAFLGLGFVWVAGSLYHHVIPVLLRGPLETDVSGVASAAGALALVATSLQDLASRTGLSEVSKDEETVAEPSGVKYGTGASRFPLHRPILPP
jgi:hypothetical protein